jgi:hypothetical protein
MKNKNQNLAIVEVILGSDMRRVEFASAYLSRY